MTTIDERVVAMRFDNEKFQAGIADTLKALDNLKRGLNIDGARKGLTDVASAMDGINSRNAIKGVEDLTVKFGALQTVALGALATIGSKLIDLGTTAAQTIGGNIFAAFNDGYSDYTKKLTSVQTIMNATGADMPTVEGFFKELDTYADKTIYNLQDMTSSFAKFTNAGVDMDKSVPAIKGIANMVALAGQDAGAASIAMYNLSQSIAGGFLTTTDYKSLNLANVATREWKDQMVAAAEAAGSLSKQADGTYKIVGSSSKKTFTSSQLFNEALSEQWATADILLGVLGEYGDETTKIGGKAQAAAQDVKSLGMMFETLAAAAGTGWTDSFDIVLGNVTESTKFFTELTARIGEYTDASAEARNEQLGIWKEMGGREAVIQGIWNVFDALKSILGPISEAFRQVFPPSLGKTLAAISFAFRDFTEGLKIGADTGETVRKVFVALFTGLKYVLDIGTAAFRIFFSVVGTAFDALSAVGSLLAPIVVYLANLGIGAEAADGGISSFADTMIFLKDFVLTPVLDTIRNLGGVLNELINGDPSKIGAAFQQAFAPMAALGDEIRQKWEGVANWFSSVFGPIIDTIAQRWGNVGSTMMNLWNMIKPIAKAITDFFGSFGDGVAKAAEDIDWDTVLSAINTGILIAIFVQFRKAFKTVTSIFDGVGDIMKSVSDALGGLTGVLESMQTRIKADALMKIAIGIGILAAAVAVLTMVDPNRLVGAVTAMATSFGILLGGLAILDKIDAEPSIKASIALGLIAASVNMLSVAVARMGAMDQNQLINGLAGIAAAMAVLVTAAQSMDGLKEGLVASSFALILMATAVTILAGAVAIFGAMPLEMLIQGGIAVVTILGALVGAAVLLSKFAPQMVLSAVGLIAMAAAINMMIIPLTTLGLLPIPILVQGLLTLGIILGGLVLAAQALSANAPKMLTSAVALIAMAAAINMLIIPITALGLLPIPTLVQGLIAVAAVMAVLVIAANALNGAIVGAGAMIVMAGAILILSAAIAILGGIGMEGIITALIALAAAFAIIGVAALLLAPLTPVILALGGALALMGLGMLALAATVAVFALGLMLLGPALLIAAGGLLAFAEVAPKIAEAVPAFLGIGAGLLAFGLGAAVAGVGVLLLGAGLVVLGAGLALVGAVGLIGATALGVVAQKIADMVWIAPQLGIMAAAFLALGAGVVVLGAGLLVLGAGAIVTALGLMMLVPTGALVVMAMNMIITAVERLVPKAADIGKIGEAFGSLGSATMALANSGRSAATGITLLAFGFTSIGTSALLAVASITMMSGAIRGTVPGIATALTLIPLAFRSMANASLAVMAGFAAGITMSSGRVVIAARALGTTLGTTVASGITLARIPVGIAVVALGTFIVATLVRQSTTVNASALTMTRSMGNSIATGIRANYGTVNTAGSGIGSNIIQGMVRGLQNGSYLVSSAARGVAQSALAAAKDSLGIHSPSREFEKIGKYVNQGFAKGLTGSKDQINAAYTEMRELVQEAYKGAEEDIKKSEERLKKLRRSRSDDLETLKDLEKERKKRKEEGKDTDALDKRIKKLKRTREDERKEIEKEKKALLESRKEKRKAIAANDLLKGKLREQTRELKGLSKELDANTEKLDDAREAYKAAAQVRDDYKAGVKDQYSGLDDIDAETKLDDYTANLTKRIQDTLEFTAKIQQLRDMGLNDKLYKELVDKGLDALPFVEQLLTSGATGVADLNKLADTLDEAAGELGNNASQELYQAGVDAARGIVQGLKAEREAIKKEMDEIAKSMVASIKKALGIKSPSREFAKVGVFADQGLAKGLKSATKHVEKASEGVGESALNSLQKSLSDISSAVAMDMDLSPAIRPVLDLSSVKRDSGLIDGMLSNPVLRADGTISTAGSAYSAFSNEQMARLEAVKAGQKPTVQFNQTNYSPKALSQAEIYRQTKNQLSTAKGALSK